MFQRHDWLIFTILIILSIIGVFTILSTSIMPDGSFDTSGIFSKQVAFVLVGVIIYFVTSLFNANYLKYPQLFIPLYIITVGVLAYVLFAGPVINNVKRWIVIGGVNLQPSELAKISIVVVTAAIFTYRKEMDDLISAFIAFVAIVPVLALIYLEPHGSMTLISLLIWGALIFTYMRDQRRNIMVGSVALAIIVGMIMLLVGGSSSGWILILAGSVIGVLTLYARESWRKLIIISFAIGIIGGMVGVVTWNSILKDYQRARIETFFQPDEVDKDQAFNVEQSKVAIGSGGLVGKGFGYGTQSRLRYLPEHQTDFVFATFAEQFGLLGSIVLIGLYGILGFKGLLYGYKLSQENLFGSMLVFGLSVKLMVEVFINIGTNTGIIPATGIPLPLISAGGTNILATFFSFGLIQSIISHHKKAYISNNVIDNEDLLI